MTKRDNVLLMPQSFEKSSIIMMIMIQVNYCRWILVAIYFLLVCKKPIRSQMGDFKMQLCVFCVMSLTLHSFMSMSVDEHEIIYENVLLLYIMVICEI